MYPWTNWLDHVTDPANVFTITDNGNNTYTITPAGTVMQQGTAQDQAHFNNIEAGILDAHGAYGIFFNMARCLGWTVDDIKAYIAAANTVYFGTATLTNTLAFPFNNSQVTVSLGVTLPNAFYDVNTEVTAFDGCVGDVVVSNKLVNGFKLAYTGSAASATIAWVAAPQVVNAAIS